MPDNFRPLPSVKEPKDHGNSRGDLGGSTGRNSQNFRPLVLSSSVFFLAISIAIISLRTSFEVMVRN
jgi:hypothetical protein